MILMMMILMIWTIWMIRKKTFFILLSLRGNRHPEFEEMYHQDQIQVRYIPQSDDVALCCSWWWWWWRWWWGWYLMMMMMIFGRYDAATEDRQIVWKKMIINFIERWFINILFQCTFWTKHWYSSGTSISSVLPPTPRSRSILLYIPMTEIYQTFCFFSRWTKSSSYNSHNVTNTTRVKHNSMQLLHTTQLAQRVTTQLWENQLQVQLYATLRNLFRYF